MLLQEYLNDTHEFAPQQWGVVQKQRPQQWIEQALQMTGVATLQSGDCPWSRHFGWYWVWPCSDRSIVNVAEVLELALPGSTMNHQLQRAEPGAPTAGSEPLNGCFATLLPIGHQHGRSPPLARRRCAHWMAWSGVPDLQDNRQNFGCQRNHADHLPSPRISHCFARCRARLLVDASLDAYDHQ